MGVFDDMLKGDESLFLDSMPLDPDFRPPVVKFRENEQQEISKSIKPLFHERSGKNLVVMGSPGIGKTVATRNILDELGKETSEIERIYVNCWKKDTPHKIALNICEQIGFKFVTNRDTNELFNEISKILNKKKSVIVLDEADKVNDEQAFYTILEDIFNKTLIFLTNDRDWLSKVDGRIRSRMMAEILEFKKYNFDEVKGILKERVNYALVPDVLEEDAFNLIAEKTFEIGDVRVGLFLLKNSAEEAENKSSKKINVEHVNVALDKLNEFHRKSSGVLNDEEKFILKVVKENSGKTAKDVYDNYKNKDGMLAYSTFLRKMKVLDKGKFITLKDINIGKGRTTKVIYGSISENLDDFFY